MLYLASLETNQALDLVHLAGANSMQRLGEAGRRAIQLVMNVPVGELPARSAEAQVVVEENARLEKESVASVSWFNDDPKVRGASAIFEKQLDATARAVLEEVNQTAVARWGKKGIKAESRSIDNRVPVRLTRGPLDFGLPESKLPPAERISGRSRYQLSGDVRFEIVNLIDGKRKMSDIERALVAEFGRDAIAGFDRYIEDLVKVGVVRWK